MIFTRGAANSYNFVRYCQIGAKDIWPDSDEARKYFRTFLASQAPYLHFDCRTRVPTFRNLDMSLARAEEEEKDQLEKIKEYVGKFMVAENLTSANLLFEYLLTKINLDCINSDFDLEVGERGRSGGVRCNILDLLCICSAESGKEPTADEAAVFSGLVSAVKIPRCLISNEKMQRLQ